LIAAKQEKMKPRQRAGLNLAFQLFAATIDLVKIIVSKFTPLFLDLTLSLFPITFYAIPVHWISSVLVSCD